MNKTQIIALCLLGFIVLDISSIFWYEFYKKRDDEPVKFQTVVDYNSQLSSAVSTASVSPSPSIEDV